MTSDMRPYPEYKDSGLPWLGRIPAYWGVRASKRMFTESGERARPDDKQLSATQAYGVILQQDYERRVGRKVVRILNHLEKRKHVEEDDFVISMRSFQGGLERAWCRGAIRSSYVVLKPGEGIHVPYFAHLFKSHPYIQALRTTSEFIRDGQDLTFWNFSRVQLPVIPLDEQKAIADYLDANAVEVRRFIRNRRRLIEVLNEQKQAIINRAVTRGLDPDVPMKDSGIDEVGNVPKHWDVRQLGRMGRFSKGNGGTKEDDVAEGVPCIRYGDLYMHYKFFVERSHSHVSTERSCDYTSIQHGDILFAGSGETIEEIGKSAVNLVESRACCGGDVILFRPGMKLVPRFMGYATYCWQGMSQKSRMGRGITIMHIYGDQLKYMWVALPPLPEQTAIVEYLCKATAGIDAAKDHAQREIDLIREHRTRLIADVVTGKVDVRHLAPAPGAELPESGPEDIDETLNGEISEEDEPELVEEAADADD